MVGNKGFRLFWLWWYRKLSFCCIWETVSLSQNTALVLSVPVDRRSNCFLRQRRKQQRFVL